MDKFSAKDKRQLKLIQERMNIIIDNLYKKSCCEECILEDLRVLFGILATHSEEGWYTEITELFDIVQSNIEAGWSESGVLELTDQGIVEMLKLTTKIKSIIDDLIKAHCNEDEG